MTGFHIPQLPAIHDLPPARFRIIRGLRLVLTCLHVRRDPEPQLETLFGSQEAAQAFLALMNCCGMHWPDPIVVQPTCCRRTSYDEILFTDLLTAVVQNNRREFDRLLVEMIGRDGRDEMYRAFQLFARPFLAARQTG